MTTDQSARTEDGEERWFDRQTFRVVLIYTGAVIGLAATAFAATVIWRSLIAGIMVPGILAAGGVGAFVRTYQVWRAEGTWRVWQVAGWVLLLLTLFFLGVPAAVW